MNALTIDLLNAPPCEWGNIIEKMASRQRAYTVDELAEIATRAAYIATYIETLQQMSGHQTSVKQARRTVKKVRKANGYSYPNAHFLMDWEPYPEGHYKGQKDA